MEKNPVYELKNQRAEVLEAAQKALEAKNTEEYEAKMADVKKLNAEIDAQEALIAEQGRFGDNDGHFAGMALRLEQEKDEQARQSKLDRVLGSTEYHNAFFEALQTFASPKANSDCVTRMRNAMTEGGGTPVGTDGGFLVPIDMSTMINELTRSFTNLADFVNTENVTTLSGWRVVEVGKASASFAAVDEMGKIPKTEQPEFKKIEYAVKKYGGIIPVSDELLSDETANLMSYLARWMARKAALTNNTLVLTHLDALTPKAYNVAGGMADLKTALNVTLDPDISNNAIILTNQSGFNFLDMLEDAQGRALLQPDPALATGKIALGRRVVMVSNNVLPDKSGKTHIYVGDFTQYMTLFRRQGFEMASTNVGGDAFETFSTHVRGLMRMDGVKVDTEAAVKLEVAL